MTKTSLIALAIALFAVPAHGQDFLSMTTSELTRADIEVQSTVVGYWVGRLGAGSSEDDPALSACVAQWLKRPSEDGLWALTEKIHTALTVAAFGSDGAVPAAEVILAAIKDACP